MTPLSGRPGPAASHPYYERAAPDPTSCAQRVQCASRTKRTTGVLLTGPPPRQAGWARRCRSPRSRCRGRRGCRR
ncbi:hypothetical protein DRA43_02105 [Micromonospora provocatoris]|nr:hypothetical protein DRA43_02105 [Micromonospora provocatoris]